MRRLAILFAAAAVLPAAPHTAGAQKLTISEVNAPAVNCVFQPSCTITVSDSVGHIPLPFIAAPNTAWLQSRTFDAAAGTPAAGLFGYMYRVSLTEASGNVECLHGLVLNFGAVVPLPYKPAESADVFVVTTGGLGSIGLQSAVKTGDVIEFTFSRPLCLSGPPNIANTTFFFGLAARTAAVPASAGIPASGTPPYFSVEARVPRH
jgi:hypothetical protein